MDPAGARARVAGQHICEVLDDEASEPYDLRTVGAGNHDFSIPVELRRSHQTRYAAEGVRTRSSTRTDGPEESVLCKLIREMNAALRHHCRFVENTGFLVASTLATPRTDEHLGIQLSIETV